MKSYNSKINIKSYKFRILELSVMLHVTCLTYQAICLMYQNDEYRIYTIAIPQIKHFIKKEKKKEFHNFNK